MTQSTANQVEPFTEQDVKLAEAAEQLDLNASQNAYLLRRVVTLRTHLNRAQAQIEILTAELAQSMRDKKFDPDSE